eukprot:gene9252-10230_t
MISLSDAQKFSEESPSIKKFKPWWEITLDYMILALLLICLLAWARVTSVEASGLICIPQGNLNATYGFVEFRYANSRCSQEFETKLIVYYPYLLFFQWVVAFLIQRTWLKVPVVITKLDAFHNIFCEMSSIMPTFRRNKQSFRMLPELIYDDENASKVKVLHDKLMFLLAEKSYLLRIYRGKVVILLLSSLAFVSAMVYWLCVIHTPKADIDCSLKGDANARQFKYLICNFSPAFFLYGVMCVNSFMLFMVVTFSCQGLYWTFKQNSFADHAGIFGQMIDHYTGLPGFKDLQFCMSLVRTNARDGNITFEIIKSCLRQDAQRLEDEKKTDSQSSSSTRRARDFEQEHAIVRQIAQELGLELIDNHQNTDHLFDCLGYIRDSLGSVHVDVTSSMREKLASEIQSNPMHFKTMIDNDPTKLGYDDVIERIRNRDVFGNQYAIAAAANVLQVRIVVIHCQSTSRNREVFEPYSTGNSLSSSQSRTTCFIAFTSPHYYHATRVMANISPRQHCNYGGAAEEERARRARARGRFASDEKYRNSVRMTASRLIERSEEGDSGFLKKHSAVVGSSCNGRTSITSENSITLLDDYDYDDEDKYCVETGSAQPAFCRDLRMLRRLIRREGERRPSDFV